MILCFSGTGNSHRVALRLAELLDENVTIINSSTFQRILSIEPGCRRIIWVMPVHSWGMPKIMRSFIASVKILGGDSIGHYLVVTCGDDTGLIQVQWRHAMRNRGWNAVAAHSVTMPNTYVLLPGFDTDPQTIADVKLNKMQKRVSEIAHAIKCASPIDNVHAGKFAWVKSHIIYPFFMRFMTSPRPFRHTDACIGCRRCASICPESNISTDEAGKPSWGKHCTLCLGCYHVCPRHAVAYGRRTGTKGQWQGAIAGILPHSDTEKHSDNAY